MKLKNTEKRYKFIVMYEPVSPTRIDKSLEGDIRKLLKSKGYEFVGSGYDWTNKHRDVEYALNRVREEK